MSLLLRRAAQQSVIPPIVIIDSGGDGSRRKAHQAKREAWDNELKVIIERAFMDAPDIDDANDVTPEVKREIIRAVRYEADMSGIDASAARIEALLAEYIKQLNDEEEEAAIMLLFAA